MKISTFISALLLLVLVTSCKKEEHSSNPLLDSWKLDRIEESFGWCGNETPNITHPDKNEYLIFNTNSSFVKLIGNTAENGTYRISGDTIFFDSNGTIEKRIYNFSDDGELILRLIMPQGSYGGSVNFYVLNH